MHHLTLLRLELILNCPLQELNPHHTRRNKDGLIVPVVPEQVTPDFAARWATSGPPSLQHSVLAECQNDPSLTTVDDSSDGL